MIPLGGSVTAPARRAGDPGSNPGPGENCSLKLPTSAFLDYVTKLTQSTYAHYKVPEICMIGLRSRNKHNLCPLKYTFRFQEKIRTSDLLISSLALYYFSCPGSINGTRLNLSVERQYYARRFGL